MRGRAYPPDLRARVMRLLAEGAGPTEVAERLMVSRATVHRYRNAAERQRAAVPRPAPSGGWRHGKVDRARLVALARLALERPKLTLEELRDAAGLDISTSAVSRALHKAGVGQRRARFVDRRTESDPLVALERRLWKEAQRGDPVLGDPDKLLFMDESNFTRHEQQGRGWGVNGGARLYRPKGKSPTYNVMAAIGAGGLLHYVVHRPAREERELAPRFEASELAAPGEGVDVGLSASEIRRHAPADDLRRVLRAHGVKLSDEQGRPLSLSDLRATVLQLKRAGRLGLLRSTRGARFLGGPRKPHRGTADDAADYLEALAQEVPGAAGRTVVWDNASSHGAQGTREAGKVSVFDRLARELGLGGVAYLPPRSPDLNPIETAFAYVKRLVRRWAPDEGYTDDGLVDAIDRAFAQVTPDMVDHWIRGCGYGPQPARDQAPPQNCQTAEADLRRPGRIACADARGTVHKVKPAGRARWQQVSVYNDDDDDLQDVQARPPPRRPPAAPYRGPRRWPGYGARPAGLVEVVPESVRLAGRDDPEVYHVERLVDRRTRRGGRVEYLVRWRGYGEEDDTWEPRAHLMAGAERMVRDWERRRRRD
jgi:transposase